MRKIALLAAAAMLLVACSSGESAPTGQAEEVEEVTPVVIQATEFEFLMPEELPAGESSFRFENVGGQPHFFEVVQVQDDVTDAQVEEALRSQGEPEWLVGSADGFGLLTPGQVATATATYEPGTYVFLCFMPDTEGKEHAALGMWNRVTVTGESPSGTEAPAADVTVEVGSDGWTLPDISGLGGEVTFAVSGTGKSQKHSFEIGRLVDESLQPSDVGPAFEEWIGGGYQGPIPLDILGGFFSIQPDRTRYLTVTLDPGAYLFHDEANQEADQLVTIG